MALQSIENPGFYRYLYISGGAVDRGWAILLIVLAISSLSGGALYSSLSSRYTVMYSWGDWAYIPDGVYLLRIVNGSLMLEKTADPVFLFGTPFIGLKPVGEGSVVFFYSRLCGATNAFRDVLERLLSKHPEIEVYVVVCTDLSNPERSCLDRGAREMVINMGVNGSFPLTPDMVVLSRGGKLYLHDFASRYASSGEGLAELVISFIEQSIPSHQQR